MNFKELQHEPIAGRAHCTRITRIFVLIGKTSNWINKRERRKCVLANEQRPYNNAQLYNVLILRTRKKRFNFYVHAQAFEVRHKKKWKWREKIRY